MFKSKNKKKICPFKPEFYYIKVGCEGYKLHGCVIMMYLAMTLELIIVLLHVKIRFYFCFMKF